MALRRLSGAALRRAMDVASVDGWLRRRGSTMLWIDRASALMPWAEAARIDADFMPGGTLAAIDSATDRDQLRAALAPRLLELGRVDAAMSMAAAASGAHVWRAHAAMLPHLHDPALAGRFVAALRARAYADLSAFAVARELQRGVDTGAPMVHAICDAMLEAADSDADLRLVLCVLAPLLHRLGGADVIEGLAGGTPPRSAAQEAQRGA
jgi:hypothetical protein